MIRFQNKKDILLYSVVTAVAFLIYYLTTNQIFSFDALTNAIAAERNDPVRWFHPNHLLYPFLGVAYYRFERLLGSEGLAIYSLARLNSILVASALALFCCTLARKTSRTTALAVTCFLGSCYAVWHFAVDGRAVGASVFFGVSVLAKLLKLEDAQAVRKRDLLVLAFLSTFYVFMHGIAIFHVAAVAWWLTRFKKGTAKLYLSLVSSALAIAYVFIFLTVVRPNESISFFQWAMGYAGKGGNYWSASLGKGLVWLWLGWKQAFLADPRSQAQHAAAWTLPLTFLALLGAGLWKERRELHGKVALITCLVIWGILCEVFITFWSPAQSGFHLHALIPWTAALLLLYHRSKYFLYGVSVSATALFLWNLTGTMAYAANLRNNDGYMRLREIRAHLNPGDAIISIRAGSIPESGVLLPYFFPELSGGSLDGRMFAFRETDLAPFDVSVKRYLTRKQAVYLHEDFFDPAVQAAFETAHALPKGEMKVFLASYRWKVAFQLSNGQKVFLLQLKK